MLEFGLAWYALGLCGCAIIWAAGQVEDDRDVWDLTASHVFTSLFASVLGLVLLIASLCILLSAIATSRRLKNKVLFTWRRR